MKKKLLLTLSMVVLMITTLVCAVGCKKDEAHKHTWATEWSVDGETHWHACTGEGCTAKKDEGNHEGGTANCTDKKVCTVCDNAYGEADSSVHKSDEFVYVSNGDGTHTKKYKCCNAVAAAPENCSGGVATVCGEKNVCEVCHTEYGEELAHGWKTEYKSDGTQHWHECSRTGCTATSEKEDCAGGTATCTAKAICTTCGNEHGDKNANNHSAATYKYEANNDGTHKKIHTCCNAVEVENENCSGGVATVCGEKNVCERCEAKYGNPLAHDLETHAAKDPTCTEIGWDEYVTCKRTGCTYTTYQEKPALNHDYTVQDKDENQHWNKCSRCNVVDETSKTNHSVATWENTDTGRIGKCSCGATVITAVENVPVKDITLYTVESLNGKNYAHTATYEYTVTVNGTAKEVTFTLNGDAATFDKATNTFTGVKTGEITVTASYTIADGVTESKTFKVIVERPEITIDTPVKYFSAIDGKDSSADMFALFGDAGFTATQVYNGQTYTLTIDRENKTLKGAHAESKTPTVSTITLENDLFAVTYNVTVYTKVINDYTDFEDMRLTADRKTVEGYFIMNADIDFTNVDIDGDGTVGNYDTFYRYYDPKALAPTDMLTDVTDNKTVAGFVGVFDGNGHKINGFRTGNSYGFFGTISGKSMQDMTVIKNVAFTNIQAGYASWTKGRVFAEYATFLQVDNVYISFNVTEDWAKNYAVFGCAETVYFRFNRLIMEMSKTYGAAASAGETAAVGMFASVVATAYYGKLPDNQWHYKMISVYNNLYLIAPKTASGRVMPLNQSTSVAVYASNDFTDIDENTSVSLNSTTLNPEVNASGTMKLYHWGNAYRYDNYDQMKEKTTKVGNWDITSGSPVWDA